MAAMFNSESDEINPQVESSITTVKVPDDGTKLLMVKDTGVGSGV
jgi:hypothetical protein